ncbi:MAG: hypothetical protein ACLGH0_06930 [Thermoanaerobaculia bacterium]
MARKKEKAVLEQHDDFQLTDEQKARVRREQLRLGEDAARKEVYKGLRGLVGKVRFDMDDLADARKIGIDRCR